MADHKKRFARWQAKLPKNTACFVDQVLTRVVPEFEKNGFVWYPDYAGGDSMQIGANDIPLQRRSGEYWPTVQILFDKRYRPFCHLEFSMLPQVCKRLTDKGYEEIPREKALVFEGPAVFSLCKGRNRSYDCQFGFHWAVFPRQRITAEIDLLLGVLPELFELFDKGIPEEWTHQKAGYVAKHVLRG